MEVVMKTKMKYLALILSASILGACSSSLQMSQSIGYQGDDLYFNPSEKYTAKSTTENDIKTDPSSTDLKFAELEKKYTEILANDTTGKVDTTIYKSEDENPYERLFSDSYQESYERRLRGRANPYYGLGSWSYMYSDDYWYASSFRGDPYYNVIVMGSDIWVEPFYISSMFGWPYSGFGFYSNYSYYWGMPYMSLYHAGFIGWAYGSYYSIWHYNDYAYGYNSGYWNGYNNINNLSNSPNYHYGRRPETGTVNYGNRPIPESASSANFNDRRRDMSEKQATFSNDKNRKSDSNLRGESRGEFQDPTKVSTRPAKDRDVREPKRDGNQITRPTRESLNVNPTRISSGDTKSSREHNPSYSRPNPGYSNEFNRPSRNYPQTEPLRNRGNEKISSPIKGNDRSINRSYNPPPRISVPSNSSDRGRSSGGSSNISRPPATRGGSSIAPSRSSSGSSSGSSSRSSGSSSSSSSSSNNSSSSSRSRSR